MFDPRSGRLFFTLDEANAILPKVRQQLGLLKELRRNIIRRQAEADIEELTGGPGPDGRLEGLLGEIQADIRSFHSTLEKFRAMGCELKDLDRGLVDFYSMRGNEVVFLCWLESEASIAWWHPLNTGVQGRQPL
jgi:hypothetical protein